MLNIRKGFTVVEVLIVVVIIAVLAALTIPRFAKQSERGVVAEAVAHLSAIRQAEAAWSLEQVNPAYTDSLANLDIEDPNVTSTAFGYAVTVTAGPPPTFTATAMRAPAGACSGSDYGSCTVTLTEAGVWGGDHPFRPT